MIPYERVEKALQYLAETDVREAEYKAEVESAKRAMDETFKTIRNELIIDVWRSINSARNKGQII